MKSQFKIDICTFLDHKTKQLKILTSQICDDYLYLIFTHNEMIKINLNSKNNNTKKYSLNLESISSIEKVFLFDNHWIVFSKINNSITKLTSKIEKSTVKLEYSKKFELKFDNTTNIVSCFLNQEKYFMLDKESSLIRVYDKNLCFLETIGSRMGYLVENESANQRLGFEFPEDMVLHHDVKIISDSGNKRIITLNNNNKIFRSLNLDEFPNKILSVTDEIIYISDFDSNILYVSQKFGFIGCEKINFNCDFNSSPRYKNKKIFVISEDFKLYQLELENENIEELARKYNNNSILLKVYKSKNLLKNAFIEIVKPNPHLIPDFLKNIDKKEIEIIEGCIEFTCKYFEGFLSNLKIQIAKNEEEIYNCGLEYLNIYLTIPSCSDFEDRNIKKLQLEDKFYKLTTNYKKQLKRFKTINNLQDIYSAKTDSSKINIYREDKTRVDEEFFELFFNDMIKKIKNSFVEKEVCKCFTDYWIAVQKYKCFSDEDYVEPHFNDISIIQMLNDFHCSIALIFLKKNDFKSYQKHIQKEISLYPSKIWFYENFIDQLIKNDKLEDAEGLLTKRTVKNKENMNYYLHLIYKKRDEPEKAFRYLSKELELFPHKVHFIPYLISLNVMKTEQIEVYLNYLEKNNTSTIDTNYNIAHAFHTIGRVEKAEYYLDRELDLFPENQNALLFKITYFLLPRCSKDELKKSIKKLAKKESFIYLLKSKVYFLLQDYQKSFKNFIKYLKEIGNKNINQQDFYLFSSLNYLKFKNEELNTLNELSFKIFDLKAKEEIKSFLSFNKFLLKNNQFSNIKEFNQEEYLSYFSTSKIARDHYFIEGKKLIKKKKYEEGLMIFEKILKYNPGNQQIFELLDELTKQLSDF